MIIGAVMVVAAVGIMIGVIHAGASGALRERRMKNLNASHFDQVTINRVCHGFSLTKQDQFYVSRLFSRAGKMIFA